MRKVHTTKHDKRLAPPATTGSFGISTSSNITADSSGMVGDGSTSLFPEFHQEKNWTSKTTSTSYDDK